MDLSEAVEAALASARKAQQPRIAVSLLCNAILQNGPTALTLTSAHLLLVRLTLESHAYVEALPVLDEHILYFQAEARQSKSKLLASLGSSAHSSTTQDTTLPHKLKYQDVLEYFLSAGTIYIGLQQWEKALDTLENVITYPVKDNAVSKIMTDAYKKWVLVKILVDGKAGSLPITTNSIASKLYHIVAKPYDTVANLFTSATAKRLREEVQVGEEIWNDDGNSGLMFLVLASYQKFQIRNLANIYSTLSVTEITNMTESAEVEGKAPSDKATNCLIQSMISDGILHASIIHSPNSSATLTFSSNGPVVSELEVQHQLAQTLRRLKSMTDDIKVTDKRLMQDKDYLKWTNKRRKSGKNGDEAADEMNWNAADDDEDLGI